MQNNKPLTGETAVFVKAVINGVLRGGYRLVRQRQRGFNYYSADKVLGIYDYTIVKLKSKQAYNLYVSLSESPLSLDQLRAELAAANIILNSNSSTLTIAGARCAALVIQRGSCAELNNLILNFRR